MKLRFLGAAETVTGSRFLLDCDEARILIDCGLFQGLKKLRERNRLAFPVKPSSIQAVILTHAHIDHSGYIPALVKHGFRGRIYCTEATYDLCSILLPDAGHLQEEEADYANRHGFSKHKPALPLYTEADARYCLKQFETIPFNAEFRPAADMTARFVANGHILGSASVYVSDGRIKVGFSGDVGRPNDPVMLPPGAIEPCDYLVVESTYGDRRHNQEPPEDLLAETIRIAAAKGANVVIPTFAVGRAQSLLYLLHELTQSGKIPKLPIFLDSPMAIDATEILSKHHKLHRLSAQTCRSIWDMVEFTRTVDESKAIASLQHPKVILSASGMLTGGRVLHHLKQYLPNTNNVIIFVGYQAAGTRGAAMLGGAESVKIHGEYYPVRAKLVNLDGLSAHADYVEISDWMSTLKQPPRQTFIVHGEPQAQDTFRLYLQDRLRWPAMIPSHGEEVELD
jgi:metallo-beta-lactamase family protein